MTRWIDRLYGDVWTYKPHRFPVFHCKIGDAVTSCRVLEEHVLLTTLRPRRRRMVQKLLHAEYQFSHPDFPKNLKTKLAEIGNRCRQ